MSDDLPIPLRLVRIKMDGAEGFREALTSLNAACDEPDPFAALVDLLKLPGLTTVIRRPALMASLRKKLPGRCLALAYVVAPEAEEQQRKRAKAASALFGCPVGVFTDAEAALGWLRYDGTAAYVPEEP